MIAQGEQAEQHGTSRAKGVQQALAHIPGCEEQHRIADAGEDAQGVCSELHDAGTHCAQAKVHRTAWPEGLEQVLRHVSRYQEGQRIADVAGGCPKQHKPSNNRAALGQAKDTAGVGAGLHGADHGAERGDVRRYRLLSCLKRGGNLRLQILVLLLQRCGLRPRLLHRCVDLVL